MHDLVKNLEGEIHIRMGIKKNRYGLNLDTEEKSMVDQGAILLFGAGLSKGTWGTPWRYVKKQNGFYNSYVATPEMLDYLTNLGRNDVFYPSKTCSNYRDM